MAEIEKVVTVLEIVAEYLRAKGCDGLLNQRGECACTLGDLAPCSMIEEGCIAGHMEPLDRNCLIEESDHVFAWHMVPGPRAKSKCEHVLASGEHCGECKHG